MMNTYWVEYEYTFNINNGWNIHEVDADARRFHCLKKDIKKEVRKYVEEDLKSLFGDFKDLHIKITDYYITTEDEQ